MPTAVISFLHQLSVLIVVGREKRLSSPFLGLVVRGKKYHHNPCLGGSHWLVSKKKVPKERKNKVRVLW